MGAAAYPMSLLAAHYQPAAPWPPVTTSSPDQATSVAWAAQFTPTSGSSNLNLGTDAHMSSSLWVVGVIGKFLVDSWASKTVPSRRFFHKFRPGVALKISEIRLESATGQPVAIDGELQLAIDGIEK